ncbi:MAG: chemotaxis protein CheX [Proteobacteria bacterium]|nr:chemotaxis protein CheX [Pseudomonadota bacterium]MBU1610273.1 chemotaxis protein CheX [Pseudomonadota bacterium]
MAKPFVKAAVDILGTMAGVQAKAGIPFAKKENQARGDVTGLVGLTGDKRGSISISFEKACAIHIVKSMLGDAIEDILSDVKDAVGEITNMVSGQARVGLSAAGLSLQSGTPTVVMGDGHSIEHVTTGTVIAIPFSTPNGGFTIEFCFE